MLQSVTRKQQELQKELDEINLLAHGLEEKIKFEQQQPEEHPVISVPKQPEPAAGANDENDESAAVSNPSTPPSYTKSDSLSPVIGLGLTASIDSTEVELGDPHTPAYAQQRNLLLHSPAHSCPMPNDSRLDQPYMDVQSAGLPRYRINSDDDLHGLHGLTWGFGCGTTLFGERLLEHDNDSGNIMQLSFDDSLVEDGATIGAQSRGSSTAHTVTGAESYAQAESPLRSGSFDGPINFRTGMSGHRGLNQTRSKASPLARPEIRMMRMSEHRGIASMRGAPASTNLKRRTTPHTHTIADHLS
jgi:hypothetical protein